MKKRIPRALSLRRQVPLAVFLCWLIPVLMTLGVMSWYFAASVGPEAEKSRTQQLSLTLQMCADRLDSAVAASRLASYDPTIDTAWSGYLRDGSYAALYRTTRSFLNRQYGFDSRFLFSVFWFSEDPGTMTITALTGGTGAVYGQTSRLWEQDFPAAQRLAAGLDTKVGFLRCGDRFYLVRNLMDSRFQTTGVLVLALNQPYYFEELTSLAWASAVDVTIGQAEPIGLVGEIPADASGGLLESSASGSGYGLSARALTDYNALMAPFRFYFYLLGGMLVLLVPLLFITFRFLRSKITQPITALMDGAAEIERGKLGYQLACKASSREFQYLTDSFNHMSGQLQNQFNRLYQEELALRDAQIKALQAHINPHFLNNTLEIINWEARMSGDAKVSKMIEALSTVLDAALDRRKSPEVRLAEEMRYVSAYLYIIDQRFGRRLSITTDIPEALMDCRVPRLILQPVIENAVEHGIGPGGHGTVALRGRLDGGFLILDIENDGGLSEQDEAHIARLLSRGYDADRESSGNIGIANVNLRLRILYGGDCGLTIFRGEGQQVVARLRITASPEPGGQDGRAATAYNK
jgi:two-component system sensor histidine kinase YesM